MEENQSTRAVVLSARSDWKFRRVHTLGLQPLTPVSPGCGTLALLLQHDRNMGVAAAGLGYPASTTSLSPLLQVQVHAGV